MVLVASVLVCLSIFSMSITFYYSEAIHVKKDSTSSAAIKFLAPLFMPIQVVLLLLLSISAFKLNHVLGLGQLHRYRFSLWVVFEHKKLDWPFEMVEKWVVSMLAFLGMCIFLFYLN